MKRSIITLFSVALLAITFNKAVNNFLFTPEANLAQVPIVLVGDLNNDNIVNSIDWSLMNSKWFTNDRTADINKDGIVNSVDFSLLNKNWLKTVVAAPPPPVVPPVVVTPPVTPSTPGTLISAMHVVRINASAPTPVFVSSGVLLPKGKLQASDVANISVKVNNLEVQRYAYALQGRWSDGSLRSVLVQFSVPLANVGDPVRVELGGLTTTPLARVEPDGEPTAVLFPDNADEMLGSGLFGPTVKRSSAPQSPAYFTKYESDFDKYEAIHWTAGGGTGGQAYLQNFYDRVLAYFVFYARTGNTGFFMKGANLAKRYAAWNESNNYGVAVWQANFEGQAMHYWLTGYEKSRDVVVYAAANLDMYQGPRLTKYATDIYLDNRTQKAVLGTKIIALELGATSVPAAYGMVALPDVRAKAASDLTYILSTQDPNGAYYFALSQCGTSKNFMTGMLNDVLGQYYDEVSQDSRIIPSIIKSYDYLMTTQWNSSQKMFQYLSGVCVNPASGGDTKLNADLNGLMLNGLGFLYSKTGDTKWLNYGEAVFEGGVNSAYISGEKQFNQWYQDSWRWLGYRVGLAW